MQSLHFEPITYFPNNVRTYAGLKQTPFGEGGVAVRVGSRRKLARG